MDGSIHEGELRGGERAVYLFRERPQRARTRKSNGLSKFGEEERESLTALESPAVRVVYLWRFLQHRLYSYLRVPSGGG